MTTRKVHLDVNPHGWSEFQDFVENNYPCDHFSREQKDFIRLNLLQDDGKCSDMNKLWIITFVQHMFELLEKGWTRHSGTMVELTEHAKVSMSRALFALINSQYALRETIPTSRRSEQEIRMLSIHPNILNVSLEMCMDMVYYLVNEDWKEKLRPLCLQIQAVGPKIETTVEEEIVAKRTIATTTTVSPSKRSKSSPSPQTTPTKKRKRSTKKASSTTEIPPQTSPSPTPTTSWNPHKKTHEYFRLCVYYTWACKYSPEEYLPPPSLPPTSSFFPPSPLEQRESWSGGKMCDEWLKEAIQLYNHLVRTTWSTTSSTASSLHLLPEYDEFGEDFAGIRKTVMHSWLKEFLIPSSENTLWRTFEMKERFPVEDMDEKIPPSIVSWMKNDTILTKDTLRGEWIAYYEQIIGRAYMLSLTSTHPTRFPSKTRKPSILLPVAGHGYVPTGLSASNAIASPVSSPPPTNAMRREVTEYKKAYQTYEDEEEEMEEEERLHSKLDIVPSSSLDIVEEGWWTEEERILPTVSTTRAAIQISPPSPKPQQKPLPLSPIQVDSVSMTTVPSATPTIPDTFSLVNKQYNAADKERRAKESQEAEATKKKEDNGTAASVRSPVKGKKLLVSNKTTAKKALLPMITEEEDKEDEEAEEEEEAVSPSLFFSSPTKSESKAKFSYPTKSTRHKIQSTAIPTTFPSQPTATSSNLPITSPVYEKKPKEKEYKIVKENGTLQRIEEEEEEDIHSPSSSSKIRRRKRSTFYQP
jgi:hypothetical protein